MTKCDVCGKESNVSDGWHLKPRQKLNGKQIFLDFCSWDCVATYIEKTMSLVFKDLNNFEKRITKLEKQHKI